ncbi:hypothetical protein E4U41_007446 [Claviceps citrina]|nr:hypothetical protein E4U41_007446 [Claviceps citrina]
MAISEGENVQSVARNDMSKNEAANHVGEYSDFESGPCFPDHQSEGHAAGGLLDHGAGSKIPMEGDDEEKPVCMFVDDCDTGSQLRKAISHLFGRNKTCTLKIPKMVWVYYCRKHYQRVRYRNARTYPVTQMELVETQIERLKAWSDQNQAKGKGAYIKSWTLSLRKREEKRLKGNKGANEPDEDASAALGARHVPAWIIDELGDGFDTSRMFTIAARLREEIESGTLNQVPEIEFLPNIVDDEAGQDQGKPGRHRRRASSVSTTKQSKRKASDASVLTDQSPMYGHLGHHTHPPDEEGVYTSPPGKRPRNACAVPFLHHHPPFHPPSSDWHGAYTMQPSHAPMASCHGFGAREPAGQGHPPRAQNVVPKMQSLEYTHHHHASAATGRHGHQGYSTGHGHARMSSYQDPREVSRSHNGSHGQLWGQYTMGRSNPPSSSSSSSSPPPPPTLPSIASHMQGHGGGPVHGHLHSGRSVAMHQRSISAHTPRSRFASLPGRLSLGGVADPAEHAGLYQNAQSAPAPAPSPTSYDSAPRHGHGPPGYGRHEWTSDYSHVPQYSPRRQ